LLELDLDGAYLIVQQETLPQFLHDIISKVSKIAGNICVSLPYLETLNCEMIAHNVT
jgi:hypothetical protein